jgi:hypothetical protein
VGKLAEAAVTLREFAERYRAHNELADHLEVLGGLVGLKQRLERDAAAAQATIDDAARQVAVKKAELAELVRRENEHNKGRRGGRVAAVR